MCMEVVGHETSKAATVTDCPAYLILSFLFRLLDPLPSVTPGCFALLLTKLPMDCSRVFQRLPYDSICFHSVP